MSLWHAAPVTGTHDPATAGGSADRLPGEPRRGSRGGNRFPPALAVVVAGALYALLPDAVRPWPAMAAVIVPAVEAALLASLLVTDPRRMTLTKLERLSPTDTMPAHDPGEAAVGPAQPWRRSLVRPVIVARAGLGAISSQ